MPFASYLLELEMAHTQLQAELLQSIATDLQDARDILINRADDFEAYSQSLQAVLDGADASAAASHLSANPSQEDALKIANAMASTDAMVEILEQLKQDMEALTAMVCKPGVTEEADAKFYLSWKNSNRVRPFNFDESTVNKAAEISALTGIKFSFPLRNSQPKVRSTEIPCPHVVLKLTSMLQIEAPFITSPATPSPRDTSPVSMSSTPAATSLRTRNTSLMSPPPTPTIDHRDDVTRDGRVSRAPLSLHQDSDIYFASHGHHQEANDPAKRS